MATTGPAEAYLVRDARLLTLPEPGPRAVCRPRMLADPEIWRGDLLAGDCLILISPNATRRIGLAPIQDAVLRLHPQVAIDQIHRQLTGGGIGVAGGDGMLALEATEVSVTQKVQPLKPVWPSDSLAGMPERSPIPLADTVADGVGVVQLTARQVQRTADGVLRHSVAGLFEHMPRRPVQRVRVTPIAVQRERQRRVASAIVGMLMVLAVVGTSLWYLAGTRHEVQRRQAAACPDRLPRRPERPAGRLGPGPRPADQRPPAGRRLSRGRLHQPADRRAERLQPSPLAVAAQTRSWAASTATTTSTSSSPRSCWRSDRTASTPWRWGPTAVPTSSTAPTRPSIAWIWSTRDKIAVAVEGPAARSAAAPSARRGC